MSDERSPSPPTHLFARPNTGQFGWVLGIFAALAVVPLASSAESEKESRYPYDPACAWGRLANGKGMIHRCLSEDEAKRLASGESAPKADPKPALAPVVTTEKAPETPKAKPRDFTVSVGPIRAEQGDITLGKLGAPVDRYRACVVDNGGLEDTRGKVVISFLVQAARSRAEGVEVTRVVGVSQKAAQCMADVIDRRRVGTPSEETTGVQLTIELIGQ